MCAPAIREHTIYIKLPAENYGRPPSPPRIAFYIYVAPKTLICLAACPPRAAHKEFSHRLSGGGGALFSPPVRVPYIYIYVFPSRVPRRRAGGRASCEGTGRGSIRRCLRAHRIIYIYYIVSAQLAIVYIYIHVCACQGKS